MSDGPGPAAAARALLDLPPPAALAPDAATALLVLGRCAGLDARRLRIAVDGDEQAPQAAGLARPGTDTPHGGFWGTVRVPARPAGAAVHVELVEAGGGARLTVARIPVREPAAPAVDGPPARPQDDAGGPLIAVCMATFDPDPALLRAQVASLRAQTDRRWVCVVCDDGSPPEALATIRDALGTDPRFVLAAAPDRVGFHGNFERALRLVPDDAELVALCDQDDRWRPDKLARLRAALAAEPRAVLAYSDQRLTDAAGGVLRDSMWVGRSRGGDDVAAMLVANTVTGAATLFRRGLLDLALPFPEPPGFRFHDHWLAVCALAAGDVAYVEDTLYDYVQHEGAVFGDVATGAAAARRRPGRTAARAAFDAWRGAYFHGYLNRTVLARTILAREPPGLSPARRRALRRVVRAERSPVALLWLAGRAGRALLGRDETLGSELGLARGVLWLWWARALARIGPLARTGLADAAAPPPWAFSQKRLRRWRARSRTAAGSTGERC